MRTRSYAVHSRNYQTHMPCTCLVRILDKRGPVRSDEGGFGLISGAS